MRKSITRRLPAKNVSQEDLHLENNPYHMKIKTFEQGYNLSMNLSLRKDLQLEMKNFPQKCIWGILVNQRISRLWRTGGSLKCKHYLYQHYCIPFPGGYQLNAHLGSKEETNNLSLEKKA